LLQGKNSLKKWGDSYNGLKFSGNEKIIWHNIIYSCFKEEMLRFRHRKSDRKISQQ
jgi:hypothetical protein